MGDNKMNNSDTNNAKVKHFVIPRQKYINKKNQEVKIGHFNTWTLIKNR